MLNVCSGGGHNFLLLEAPLVRIIIMTSVRMPTGTVFQRLKSFLKKSGLKRYDMCRYEIAYLSGTERAVHHPT
jgi:hypothetical protein